MLKIFNKKKFIFLILFVGALGIFLMLFDFFIVLPVSKYEINQLLKEDLKRKSNFLKKTLSENNIDNINYACRHLQAMFDDEQLPINILTYDDMSCSQPSNFIPNVDELPNGFSDYKFRFKKSNLESYFIVHKDGINNINWLVGKSKPVEITFMDYFNFSFIRQVYLLLGLIKFIVLILTFYFLFYYACLRRWNRELGNTTNDKKYHILDKLLSTFELDNLWIISNLFKTMNKMNELEMRLHENDNLYLEKYYLIKSSNENKHEFTEMVSAVSIDINNWTNFTKFASVSHQMSLKLQVIGDEFLIRFNGFKQKPRGDDISAVFSGENHCPAFLLVVLLTQAFRV